MKSLAHNAVIFALAGALTLGLAGCGQAMPSASQDGSQGQAAASGDASATSIDVTTLGAPVATYEGAKYIVSDATVDQAAASDEQVDLGLQEVCVVRPPAAWGSEGTLGWGRNSICYTRVPTEWGSYACNYAYRNESGVAQGAQTPVRASEEGYFENMGEVQHITIGEHDVSYVVDKGNESAKAIPDLEAQASEADADAAAGDRSVTVYAFEQRADKCAFTSSVICSVDAGATFDLTGEQLVTQLYEPLEFVPYDQAQTLDAASYMADMTIADAADEHKVVVALKGGDLLAYSAHQIALADPTKERSAKHPVSYDFAPTDEPAEDAESYEVEGYAVSASMVEQNWGTGVCAPLDRVLTAWVDLDGSPLRIEAIMAQGEDMDAALERLVGGGRLTLQ